MTRYAYDDETFLLTRQRTERYTEPVPDGHIFRPDGLVFQDSAYEYDLVGNVLSIHDRAPKTGAPNTKLGSDAFDHDYGYDPTYHLLTATGPLVNTLFHYLTLLVSTHPPRHAPLF
jgi:hypothetical protein